MPSPSLADLLIQQTKAVILSAGLSIAQTIGLPVTSWQAGDPSRALLNLEATILEALENVVVGFIQSGFLDYATAEWLVILAQQVFNVTVPTATFAETSVTLTNSSGGIYIIEPGDLTFKDSTTGQTYHNTTGGTLAASGTLSLDVTADTAGSIGSAGAGEIDALVTTLLGVTCTNPIAAVGIDQQDDSVTRQQCRDKLGSLSPNGPASAYSYVARNSALTGIQTITRARPYPDSDTGDVLLYLATASGAPNPGDVTAVADAINVWALPLTITPTVLAANNVTVPVTYTIWIYKSVNQTSTQVQTAIQTALENLFADKNIGGDIIPPAATGAFYLSDIEGAIAAVFPQIFRVSISAPSGDTALANGDVAVLGTMTPTINFVSDPS